MTDLERVLARMLRDWYMRDWAVQESDMDWPAEAEVFLATPEGRALAALVEAAEAWERSVWPEKGPMPGWVTVEEDALKSAIDAYREATRER